MSNYRLIQILTSSEGGLSANQRIDVDITGSSPTFSAVTVSNDLNVDGQINGNLSSNTSFTAHTGDTTIHFTKDSINLSDLGSSAHTHTISEVVNLQSNLNAKSTNAWQTFSSATAGQTVVTAATVDDTVVLSGINLNIITDNTNKTITLSAGTGGSFNSFDITDGSVTETINDGDTITFSTNSGLTATVSATDTVTFDLDITGTTAEASPANGDKLLIWEAGSGTHRNIDWNQLPGAGGGGSSRTTGSTQTTNATPATGDTISTLTDNNTNIIEVYVKAYVASAANWGVWKRTLTVTSVSGTVVIREVNADVDKTSAGLSANSVDFEVSGSNINILLTGINATTIDWETAWEIIL